MIAMYDCKSSVFARTRIISFAVVCQFAKGVCLPEIARTMSVAGEVGAVLWVPGAGRNAVLSVVADFPVKSSCGSLGDELDRSCRCGPNGDRLSLVCSERYDMLA